MTSAQSPLQKRIRRHIQGRIRTFFASTAPGLEYLCYQELTTTLLSETAIDVSVLPGGVAFRGRLDACYLANLHLRTANRVLMRIDRFKAHHFDALEKSLTEIPWELYLTGDRLPNIRVACHHSRLYHSDAVAQRVSSAIARRFEIPDPETGTKIQPEGEGGAPDIYVRALKDQFTLSIDSTGDHLYRRGLKEHWGEAPIRETLAAAIFKIAGYEGEEPLLDPMCGAGTFSLEAASLAAAIPAGAHRDFAFAQWPAFSPDRWRYLRNKALANRRVPPRHLIMASDNDPEAVRRLADAVNRNSMSEIVSVSRENFFHIRPSRMPEGFLVINPPYGERLSTPRESRRLFSEICRKIRAAYRGRRFALIAPHPSMARYLGFPARTHPLFHGGRERLLLHGRVP